jgi:hypothetical protein
VVVEGAALTDRVRPRGDPSYPHDIHARMTERLLPRFDPSHLHAPARS